MENNTQLAIKDADGLVSGAREISEYLRTLSQSAKFITNPVQNLNDRILSFVYQCKKMKKEELVRCTRGSIAEAFKTSLDVGLPVNAYQLAFLEEARKLGAYGAVSYTLEEFQNHWQEFLES